MSDLFLPPQKRSRPQKSSKKLPGAIAAGDDIPFDVALSQGPRLLCFACLCLPYSLSCLHVTHEPHAPYVVVVACDVTYLELGQRLPPLQVKTAPKSSVTHELKVCLEYFDRLRSLSFYKNRGKSLPPTPPRKNPTSQLSHLSQPHSLLLPPILKTQRIPAP